MVVNIFRVVVFFSVLNVVFLFFYIVVFNRIKVRDFMDFGIVFLFYGFYYGVMGRDFVEICFDYMVFIIGVSVVFIF